MFRVLLTVLCLPLLFSCTPDDNREVTEQTSPNGFDFSHMPIWEDGVTDITIKIAWPSRWPFDTDRNPITPYAATRVLMNSGTSTQSPQEVMEMFQDANARSFLALRPEYVIGELSMPKEHVDSMVTLVAEILADPHYTDDWLERTKHQLLEQASTRKSAAAPLMFETLRRAALGDQPIADYFAVTDTDQINALTLEDLFAWHQETLTQTDLHIVVTGAISAKDAGHAIDQLLAGLPQGTSVPPASLSTQYGGAPIVLISPDLEKTMIGMMGPLPPYSIEFDVREALAAQSWMAFDGPLHTKLREQLQATYGFRAGTDHFSQDNRFWITFGDVENVDLATVGTALITEYERFRSEFPDTRFEQRRDTIANVAKGNLTYVNVSANTVLEYKLNEADPASFDDLPLAFSQTTQQQLASHIATHFPRTEELITVAVTPHEVIWPEACIIRSLSEIQTCRP